MDAAKALLAVAAIGTGIYIALRYSFNPEEPQPDTGYFPYDPYETGDPYTAYAGTIEPMDKVRYSPRTLQVSPAGLARIEQFEGRRKTAYKDSAGNWTIGVGHLIRPGDGLTPQSVLNDGQINVLFGKDIIDVENSMYNRILVPMTQGEFDAIADFVFQFGDAKFGSSTLLRLLNARNYDLIPAELAKWINVNGVPSQQIIARRADDAKTFLT